MRRLLPWGGCLTLIALTGCAICDGPNDYQYAAYGGLRQRTDMVQGRVGSVFDPASEISHGGRPEQSPELATPELLPSDQGGNQAPDAPRVPLDDEAPGPREGPVLDGRPLPRELPEGTIELPDQVPGDLPAPGGDLPSPSILPPDLPGGGRSAQRHPLHRLLDDEL